MSTVLLPDALAGAFALLQSIFGGDAPAEPLSAGQVAARGVLIYVAGLALVRLGKSRLLSRATPLDVILAFILGSVLSRGITGGAALSATLMAAATLIAMHWLMTYLAVHSHWWGCLVKGNEYVLITDGVIDRDNLRQSHISERDLREHLRLNANIDDPAQVLLAVKERSGAVGVVRKPPQPVTLDVAVERGVQTVRIVLTS